MEDVPQFLSSFEIEGTEKEKCQAQLNAIHVAFALSKFDSSNKFLVSNDNLRKSLLEAAKSLEFKLRQNSIDPELGHP